MDRRSAIKYTSLTGVGISSAFITGLISGCKPEASGVNYKPILLDQEKFVFLKNLSEVLIPQTDTPGAIELELAEWIDTIVKKCYTEEDQKQFSTNLDYIKSFCEGEASEVSILTLENVLGDNASLMDAYHSIKSTIATAYIATEYVGTKLLNYLPVPGEYEACIPLSKTNGKAWTI